MTQAWWGGGPVLRVDGTDVVTAVDERWNELVSRRRVGALRPAEPGRPFWESVDNGDALALYRVMLERARSRFRVGIDVRFVDAGGAARGELGLVLRDQAGTVELSLRVLREQRTWSQPLFDPDATRSLEEVSVCDFCQRALGFDWVEPEVALRQLRVPADGPWPRTHAAICDDCERGIYAACHASRLGVG